MNVDDDIVNKYRIDALVFSKNVLSESLDFEEIPSLIVEIDLFETLYLSYLDKFIDGSIEQRILIKITKAKLNKVKDGSISIRDAFGNPESDDVYVSRFKEETGEVVSTSLIPASIFSEINPISSSYTIEITPSIEPEYKADNILDEITMVNMLLTSHGNDFFSGFNNKFPLRDENEFKRFRTKDISTGNYHDYRN